MPGMTMSSSTTSNGPAAERVERLAARADGHGLVRVLQAPCGATRARPASSSTISTRRFMRSSSISASSPHLRRRRRRQPHHERRRSVRRPRARASVPPLRSITARASVNESGSSGRIAEIGRAVRRHHGSQPRRGSVARRRTAPRPRRSRSCRSRTRRAAAPRAPRPASRFRKPYSSCSGSPTQVHVVAAGAAHADGPLGKLRRELAEQSIEQRPTRHRRARRHAEPRDIRARSASSPSIRPIASSARPAKRVARLGVGHELREMSEHHLDGRRADSGSRAPARRAASRAVDPSPARATVRRPVLPPARGSGRPAARRRSRATAARSCRPRWRRRPGRGRPRARADRPARRGSRAACGPPAASAGVGATGARRRASARIAADERRQLEPTARRAAARPRRRAASRSTSDSGSSLVAARTRDHPRVAVVEQRLERGATLGVEARRIEHHRRPQREHAELGPLVGREQQIAVRPGDRVQRPREPAGERRMRAAGDAPGPRAGARGKHATIGAASIVGIQRWREQAARLLGAHGRERDERPCAQAGGP